MIFGYLKKRSNTMAKGQPTKGKTKKEIAEEIQKKFQKKPETEKLKEIKNAKQPNEKYGMLIAYKDLRKSTNKKTRQRYRNYTVRLYLNCVKNQDFFMAKIIVENFRDYFSKSQWRKAISGYQKQNPNDKKYPKNCRIKA